MRPFLLPSLVVLAAGCGSADPLPTCPLDELQREVLAAEAMRLRYEAFFLTSGVSTSSHFGGGKQLLDEDSAATSAKFVTSGCAAADDLPEFCESYGPEGARHCETLHCEGGGNAIVSYRWAPDDLVYTSRRGLHVRYEGAPALHFARSVTGVGFEDHWSSADVVHVEVGGKSYDLSGSITGSSANGTLNEVTGTYPAIIPGRDVRIVVGPGTVLGEPDGRILLDGAPAGTFPLANDGGVFWNAEGCL